MKSLLLTVSALLATLPAFAGQMKRLLDSPVGVTIAPNNLAVMPTSVASAFNAGDSRAFYRACVACNFTPPASDDSQWNLLREGAAISAADRIRLAQSAVPEKPAPSVRTTVVNYDAFGDSMADFSGINEANKFSHTREKRIILAAAGYAFLIGKGGVRIPIAEATAARIGDAFSKTLATFRRRSARP